MGGFGPEVNVPFAPLSTQQPIPATETVLPELHQFAPAGVQTAPGQPMQVASLQPTDPNDNRSEVSLALLNQKAKDSAGNLQYHRDNTGVVENLKKVSQNSGGGMATFLAVAAALNGNFGPAIALNEQKKKSKIYAAALPAFTRANEMANTGQLEEAVTLLQTAAASTNERAPELTAYFQKGIETISSKQSALIQGRAVVDVELEAIKGEKDHPNKNLLTAMKKSLDSGVPLAMDALKGILERGRLNITTQDGKTIATSPTTNRSTYQTVPQVFSHKSLSGTINNTLSGQTGKTPEQIDNIMNGPDTPEKAALQQTITALQKREGQIDTAKNIPVTPEFMIAMQQVPGMTTERLAKKQFTPDELDFATAKEQQRKTDLATAPIDAANRRDVTKLTVAGLTIIDKDPTSPSFGRDMGAMSPEKMEATPNRGTVSTKIHQAEILPTLRAASGLEYIPRMLEELGFDLKGDTPFFDRAGAGLVLKIESYLGVTLDKKSSAVQVMRLIADRSIEQLGRTEAVSSDTVRQLKEQVIRGFVDPQTALEAVKVMRERINSDLSLYMGENKGDYRQETAADVSTGSISNPTILKTASSKDYGGIDVTVVNPTFMSAIKSAEGTPDGRRSHKGAVGPYQIILKTGKRYLELLGIPATEENLQKPEINFKVAAMHLADLERTFPGDYAKQSAMYFSGNPDVNNGKSDGAPGKKGTVTSEYVDRTLSNMKKQEAAAIIARSLPQSASAPTAKSTPEQAAAYRKQNEVASRQKGKSTGSLGGG